MPDLEKHTTKGIIRFVHPENNGHDVIVILADADYIYGMIPVEKIIGRVRNLEYLEDNKVVVSWELTKVPMAVIYKELKTAEMDIEITPTVSGLAHQDTNNKLLYFKIYVEPEK